MGVITEITRGGQSAYGGHSTVLSAQGIAILVIYESV